MSGERAAWGELDRLLSSSRGPIAQLQALEKDMRSLAMAEVRKAAWY